MKFPSCMRLVNTEDMKYMLWQTDKRNFRIELFDRQDLKLYASVNFINKAYEEVSSEFDFLTKQRVFDLG